MSKPEVLAWLWMAYGKQVTVDPGGAEKLITDGETVEPLIRLTDHEAARALSAARIAELEGQLDDPFRLARHSKRYVEQLREEKAELLGLLRDVREKACYSVGEAEAISRQLHLIRETIDATLARLGKEGGE